MARRKSKRKSKKLSALSIVLVIVLALGYFVYVKFIDKPVEAKGAISFHFMTLGNGASGDCVYIKAGQNDILIDGGSEKNSIDDIKDYVDDFVTDNKFEYVIITHGDEDHIAGYAKKDGSLFDLFECGIIIDFPRTSKTTNLYNDYLSERADEIENGAIHYTALQCYNNEDGAKREYDLSGDGNVKMQILYNYYYENNRGGSEENDYSVCVQFVHGDRKFLFTGDLEKQGESHLVDYNDLSKVVLYKAGHHGSATSTNEKLMSVIRPEICVVTCAVGDKHDFPRQEFINRISPYTDRVYVTTMANEDYTGGLEYTDFNGDIVVVSDENTGVTVTCSNNQTLLKDTEWFLENRTLPPAWKN